MAYDNAYNPQFARSISRRPSLSYSTYGGSMPPAAAYSDPGMYGTHARDSYAPAYGAGTMVPLAMNRRMPSGYEDMDHRDAYDYDRSHAAYARPTTPGMMAHSRSRRHSVMSYMQAPQTVLPPQENSWIRGSGRRVKFKRKGALLGGIGLDEAQSHVRLSNNDGYSFHDLHADHKRLLLRVNWSGYHPMTYEIPLDGWNRRVDLETLARRVSRACVHYLQANVIPILWDRVVLHSLEEVSYGVWQPMLSTR